MALLSQGNPEESSFQKANIATSDPGHIACHKMIGHLCNEFANMYWDEWISQNNRAYKELKQNNKLRQAQEIFIDTFSGTFIDQARGYLAKALADPMIPAEQKAPVVEALMLDATIPHANERVGNAIKRAAKIMCTHPMFRGSAF
jgi:hypothetical protein